MDIEQVRPNKPNFGLIVGISMAFIVVFLIVAMIFVRFDGKHLTIRHTAKNPNARLITPTTFPVLEA